MYFSRCPTILLLLSHCTTLVCSCASASFLFALTPNKSLPNNTNHHNKYSCVASTLSLSKQLSSRCGRSNNIVKRTARTSTELSAVQFAAKVGSTVANFYKTSPFTAGFITASTRAAIADSIAQKLDECIEEFNLKRNIAMVLYSGVILGLCCEVMFNCLFPVMFRGENNPLLLAVKMALFDVFINAPLLWLPPAYIAQALAYRYPKREAIQKYFIDVRENGLLNKYFSLWLPASLTNFLFVPPHFRVAFVAAVGFFWMIILSLVANKGDQSPVECPLEPEPKLDFPRAME